MDNLWGCKTYNYDNNNSSLLSFLKIYYYYVTEVNISPNCENEVYLDISIEDGIISLLFSIHFIIN